MELKSMNNSIASRFFAYTHTDCMSLWGYGLITLKVVLIFPKNFLDFRLDMIEKQGIISFSSMSYAFNS